MVCPTVHTVDTTRLTWVLQQMVKIKQPVLLVGESGTSKTATTQNFLKNLNEETNVSPRGADPARDGGGVGPWASQGPLSGWTGWAAHGGHPRAAHPPTSRHVQTGLAELSGRHCGGHRRDTLGQRALRAVGPGNGGGAPGGPPQGLSPRPGLRLLLPGPQRHGRTRSPSGGHLRRPRVQPCAPALRALSRGAV